MNIRITQKDEDKTDYLKLFCKHLENNGIKTQEQLESRFDALALDFAIKHRGEYDPKTKTLLFTGQNWDSWPFGTSVGYLLRN